jgi:hypothetical protein
MMYALRDEGIVLKDLGSKWEPSDRSGKWLKLKPEYIRAGSDLDVLIIGLYSFLLILVPLKKLNAFHCLCICQ